MVQYRGEIVFILFQLLSIDQKPSVIVLHMTFRDAIYYREISVIC